MQKMDSSESTMGNRDMYCNESDFYFLLICNEQMEKSFASARENRAINHPDFLPIMFHFPLPNESQI